MAVRASEQEFLDEVGLEHPWALVETFATTHRWMPEDVNKAVEEFACEHDDVAVLVLVVE